MFKITALLIIFVLIISFTEPISTDKLTENSLKFAINLYKQCIANVNENFIFSPLSIEMVIALLYMSAKGKTKNEIENILQYNESDSKTTTTNSSDIEQHYGKLLNSIKNNTALIITNKIYYTKADRINQRFKTIAEQQFNTLTEEIDFVQSENALVEINNWVANITDQKIIKLLESISSDAKMIVLNVIHFKGFWKIPFKKDLTLLQTFHMDKDNSVMVPMMYVEKSFLIGFFDNFQVIELPYQNSDLSMLIFLPDAIDGLQEFIDKKLDTMDLDAIYDGLHYFRVDVFLPKFNINSTIDLPDVLKKIGLNTMFSEEADFGDLFESHDKVTISNAVQKATITIDEQGTVADASSGFEIVPISLPPSFKADHPFLFMIKQQKQILFIGSVTKFE